MLVSLLLITLTLIAITEYACRTIPNHSGIGAIGNIANDTLKRDLVADVTLGHAQLVQRLENCTWLLLPLYSQISLYGYHSQVLIEHMGMRVLELVRR